MTAFLSRLVSRSTAPVATTPESFRPTFVEDLEERRMMSVAVAAAHAAPLAHGPKAAITVNAKPAAAAAKTAASTVLPLSITGVALQDGQLVASGLLGSNAFTAPITIDPSGVTDVLNLHLGPIHLDVLGLVVDTSQICLDITATPGPGNLLGNLLSGVANLLNGGTPLGTVLGGLSSTDLDTLTGTITSLLNNVLGQVTAPSAITGVSTAAAPAGTVDILNLSLGPVDLNLLGLGVSLDNCEGGPITVDITAEPGPGNLLGNLLGNLAHLLDSNANTSTALVNAINRVANQIGRLVNALV